MRKMSQSNLLLVDGAHLAGEDILNNLLVVGAHRAGGVTPNNLLVVGPHLAGEEKQSNPQEDGAHLAGEDTPNNPLVDGVNLTLQQKEWMKIQKPHHLPEAEADMVEEEAVLAEGAEDNNCFVPRARRAIHCSPP